MSKSSVINIRVKPEIKSQAEEMFSKYGITISDAMNIFLHKALMVGGVPFDLLPLAPNAETIAAINEVEDMRSGKIPKKTMSVADFANFMSTTVTLRLKESQKTLISNYAAVHGVSMSELMLKATLDVIEDAIDLRDWHEAKEEFDANPVTYSSEEIMEKGGLS